jgi:hypothetical protein
LVADKDAAALQLGIHLASWGMYRGSSFPLLRSYTVHTAVIERLASPEFSVLWETEVGARAADAKLVPSILAAVAAVKQAYKPFGKATDTLATKVLLGPFACLPACDRFFIDGFKMSGHQYSYLNGTFVEEVIRFCIDSGNALREEQRRIDTAAGVHWQIGY